MRGLIAHFFKASEKAETPSFIVSIDQVEQMIGLDFMPAVPDELEADIEDVVELMW
jgi:hypothetical protein